MFRIIKRKLRKGNESNSEQGQVLIVALVILLVGSLIITSSLAWASAALKQGTAIEKRNTQLYSADGSVNQAVFWITNPTAYTAATVPTVVNNYSSLPLTTDSNIKYKSYVTYLGLVSSNKTYKVTSYAGPNIQNNADPGASQPGPYTKIVAQVVAMPATTGIFDNAISAIGGDINMTKNNSEITSFPNSGQGNVYATGNIGPNGTIDGNATAGGTVTNNVNGTTTQSAPPETFSAVDTTAIMNQGITAKGAATQYNSSSYASGTHTLTGPVQLNGDLNLTGSLTVNGDLYVNGALNISGSLTVNANGSQKGALGVKNDLTLSGSLATAGTIYAGGMLFYSASTLAQKGNILIQGDCHFSSHPQMGSDTVLPVLMVLGSNFTIGSGQFTMDAFVYAPNAVIDFTPAASPTLEGAIFAKGELFGNDTFTFLYKLSTGLPGAASAATVSIQTWNATTN